MPAEIVTLEWCADYDSAFEVEGSRGDTYTVTWNMLEARCTCKGFEFRRQCKHADAVFEQGCFANPQWKDAGPRTMKPVRVTDRVVPGGVCPGCGGPTIAVRCAV